MALQAVLAQNTAVAMASLVHVFVLRVFAGDYPRVAPVLRFSPLVAAPALKAAADDLKGGRAWQMLQLAQEAWRTRLPERQDGWLPWLVGLPMNDLIELLALRTALTANALPGTGAGSHANAIGVALGLDMADWWQATAEGYLRHVPKAQIIQALKAAGPDLAGGGVEAMKKDELVTVAASRLAGTRWLPEPLRAVSS